MGISDAISMQNESRVTADEALHTNQQFLLGSSIATLTERVTPEIWAPEDERSAVYHFRIDEQIGDIPVVNGSLESNDKTEGGAQPWTRACVQQVAIATLTNNRPCHATQIGIKSEVWRQMTGSANFNGHPTPETIEDYEEDMAQISLGTMSKYMKRYSFFRLFARAQGADNWINITGTAPFAVRGVSPTSSYNTLHIDHPETDASVHEYRLVPVPGSEFYDVWNRGGGVSVHLLDGATLKNADPDTIKLNGYRVRYTGHRTSISNFDAQNPEWILNDTDELERVERGPIGTLGKYNNGKAPIPPLIPDDDRFIDKRYDETAAGRSYVEIRAGKERRFWWKGSQKTGTIIRAGLIEVQENGGFYQYEGTDLVKAYEPGRMGTGA